MSRDRRATVARWLFGVALLACLALVFLETLVPGAEVSAGAWAFLGALVMALGGWALAPHWQAKRAEAKAAKPSRHDDESEDGGV